MNSSAAARALEQHPRALAARRVREHAHTRYRAHSRAMDACGQRQPGIVFRSACPRSLAHRTRMNADSLIVVVCPHEKCHPQTFDNRTPVCLTRRT